MFFKFLLSKDHPNYIYIYTYLLILKKNTRNGGDMVRPGADDLYELYTLYIFSDNVTVIIREITSQTN